MSRDMSEVLSQDAESPLPPIEEFVSQTQKDRNTEQEYFEQTTFKLKATAIGPRAQGKVRAEYLAEQSQSSREPRHGQTAEDLSMTGHGESGGSLENHCHFADARNLLTGHNLGGQPTICELSGTGGSEPETWRMRLDTALNHHPRVTRVCDCSECSEQQSNSVGRLSQPNEPITTEFLTSNGGVVRGTNKAIIDRQVTDGDGKAVDHRHPEGRPVAINLPVASADGPRDRSVPDSGCGDTGDWLDIPEANAAPAVKDDRDLLPSRRGPTPASAAFKPRPRSTISTAKRLRRAAAARLARAPEADKLDTFAEPPYTTRDMQTSIPRRRPLSFADEVIKLTDSVPEKSKLDRTIMEKVSAHLKRLEWTKVKVESVYSPAQFLVRLFRHFGYRCTGHYRAHPIKRRVLEFRFPVYRRLVAEEP